MATRVSTLARAGVRLLPYAAQLRARYFTAGLDRALCRQLHDAARARTLYRFAPLPPFRLHAERAGHAAYVFRSPYASPWPARNEACVELHRAGAGCGPLVVLNLAGGRVSRWLIARPIVSALLAAGVDVAVPIAPGVGSRRAAEDRRLGWAHTVGAALSAIVQLVHDNVAIEWWARERGYRAVVASGIGVGGTVAAVLAATTSRFDAYVPVVAGAHPGRLWIPPRPLARAVHAGALARAGVRSRRALARLFDPVAPNRLPPPRAPQRCTIVGLRFDTLVPAHDVRDLAAHWSLEPRALRWIARGTTELRHWPAELAQLLARIARR